MPPNGTQTEDIPENTNICFTDKYEYQCKEGYATTDDCAVVCLANKTFSPHTGPTCEKIGM